MIASFFVGIAGTLLAHYLGSINPNQFAVGIMVYVLVWVIVGGTATFSGSCGIILQKCLRIKITR